nr:DUF2484 family protein [Paracoccus marinaquae]
MVSSCAIAALWALLACLVPFWAERYRFHAFWVMVFLGVPVLGWLTLQWGPGVGVAAFALGLAILFWPPFRPHRDRMLPPLE